VSAATLIFGAESPTPRHTLAFSISLLLHLTFAVVILPSICREVPSPPLEISIFEGAEGPASPPPGERSAEPGPVGPPAKEVHPIEAPPAPQVETPHVNLVAGSHPAPKAIHMEERVEKRSLSAPLKEPGPAPTRQVLESAQPSVALREASKEGIPPVALGTARSRIEAGVGSVAAADPQASSSLGAGVAPAVLPGPGGGGIAWTTGSGGTGNGGGGTGRGGFSVSGAGAGGAGRSYTSIWESTQRYLARLRLAYNNALRNDAAVRGVIVVRYEILGSGAVGDVAMLSSQLRDPYFEEEVLNQIRGWRYTPEPTGTVVVTWPLSFLPPS
jgi:TonB family protein